MLRRLAGGVSGRDAVNLGIVFGQHGRAVGGIDQGGIAEKHLALHIDAAFDHVQLPLQFGRAIPDIAGLRLGRAVRADADIEGDIAGCHNVLPPVEQDLEVRDLVADGPVELGTDIIDRAGLDPFDRIAVYLTVGGAAVGFAAFGVGGLVIPDTGGADAEREVGVKLMQRRIKFGDQRVDIVAPPRSRATAAILRISGLAARRSARTRWRR